MQITTHIYYPQLRSILAVAILAIAFFLCPINAQEAAKRYQMTREDKIVVQVVTRLIEQVHYSHPKIDDNVSTILFAKYLQKLDNSRYFFLEEDIRKFSKNKELLCDLLKRGDAEFAFAAFAKLIQRVGERVRYVNKRIHQPFDFSKQEETLRERKNAPWAKNIKEMNELWRKLLKNHLLQNKLRALTAKDESKTVEKNDVASIDAAKEQIIKRYQGYHEYLRGNDNYDIVEMYLTSFTEIFDPHSSYLNWRTLSNFDIAIKLSLQGIGAVLTNEDGYAKVVRIIPGGPAEKQGELKAGYLITAVAQGNGPFENVVGMPLNKAVQKIRGKKGTVVRLMVIKEAQGVPFIIKITRDEIKLTEQAASGDVREILANGRKVKIGVIDVPSFYTNFVKDANKRIKTSTSADIKRIIDKLTKEQQITGILIDLRANGGGVLEEAIDLTGFFVPSGPVVQIKSGNTIKVRNDDDHNFAYKLPVVVLVNTFSASASEIFAAALQDYQRAIIVGARTHGKGTVQNLLDLKRIEMLSKLRPGALKYTMAKFYRVTGGSTQQRGVTPDIVFPSFTNPDEHGEASFEHVLPWDEIDPLQIDISQPGIKNYIPTLRKKHLQRAKASKRFRQLQHYINRWNEQKNETTISLNFQTRLAEQQERDKWYKRIESMLGKEKNADSEEDSYDLYLEESLKILADLIAQQANSSR